MFSGSSQAVVAASNPQFGIFRGVGNGSIPAPKRLEDPRFSRSGVPESGQVKHGLLPMLSGSTSVLRFGRVDWRESAAIDVGSIVGQGGVSGQQVGHTGSRSANY